MQIQYRSELNKLVEHFNLPKVYMECGVAEGWFTKEILKWDFDKLYLIDAWKHLDQNGDGSYNQSWHDDNYRQVLERTKDFGNKVIILMGLSAEMAKYVPDNTLGCAYLDADHSYNSVLNDLINYYPKVVNGGIISGHDFLNMTYGVNAAVKEFCEEMGFEINVIPDEEPHMASFWFVKNVIL